MKPGNQTLAALLVLLATAGILSCSSTDSAVSRPEDQILVGAVWSSGGLAPYQVSAVVYTDGVAEFFSRKGRFRRLSADNMAELRSLLESPDVRRVLDIGWQYDICCDVPVLWVYANGRLVGDLPVVPQKGLIEEPLEVVDLLDRVFSETFGEEYRSWISVRGSWDW